MTRDENPSRLAIRDAAYKDGHHTALTDLRVKVAALLAHEPVRNEPVAKAWNFAILSVLALIDKELR